MGKEVVVFTEISSPGGGDHLRDQLMLSRISLAALAFVVSSIAHAQMPTTLRDKGAPTPSFIKEGGAQVIDVSPAPGGLTAYTAVKDGKPIVFYTTADRSVTFVGVLFDSATGKNLSDPFVERSQALMGKAAPAAAPQAPATAVPGGQGSAFTKRFYSDEVAGMIEGKASPEGTTYVFFDPRCPYCHGLFNATRQVAKQGASIKWIPVNTLGAQGVPLSAEALRLGIPGMEALAKGTLRGVEPTILERERIQANTALFAAVVRQVGKDAATPTIVFQAPNGKLTVVQDDGSDKAAFAAAFRVGAK